jgi:xylulose-5-phosphate/fructose-6-phosphate phosphoketolase
MIVLRSPKGWTGPKAVDGLRTEGSWRSHQVPFGDMRKPGHLRLLEEWMRSYHPEELFDKSGALYPEIAALAPKGNRRMSANPHANGGALMRPLRLPAFETYGVPVVRPGESDAEATRIMGESLRDVLRENAASHNFRLFGPDETASNRLQAVFEATSRAWNAETIPGDDHLAQDGRVTETGRRAGRGDGMRRRCADPGLAAVCVLREYVPELKLRVVNIVDLMTLQPKTATRTAWQIAISTRFLRRASR